MSKDDIVPELLKKIKKMIDDELSADEKINSLKQLNGTRNSYHNASEYADLCSEIVFNAIKENITEDTLPNGKLYFNISNRILSEIIPEQYNRVVDYSLQLIETNNQDSKIGIKPIRPKIDKSKVEGMVELTQTDKPLNEKMDILHDKIQTFSRIAVDDVVNENFAFHGKAGLVAWMDRTSSDGCCEYCSRLIGKHTFPLSIKEAFTRHDHCNCLIEYTSKKGKTTYFSKQHDALKEEIINERIEFSTRSNNNELRNKAYYFARELGLKPLTEEQALKELRKQSREWIKTLTPEEVRAVSKYTYNAKDADGKNLFEKINGFLGGYYLPDNEKELEVILRNSNHIRNALLKFELSNDIIVYRKDDYLSLLDGTTQKFISTSINPSAALTGKPNVAIIIPKGPVGAYVENLSHDKFKHQLEFIINHNVPIKEVYKDSNIKILVTGGKGDEKQ